MQRMCQTSWKSLDLKGFGVNSRQLWEAPYDRIVDRRFFSGDGDARSLPLGSSPQQRLKSVRQKCLNIERTLQYSGICKRLVTQGR